MEEVHGVDVSWIHRSHKDRLYPTRSAPAVPPKDDDPSGKPTTVVSVTSADSASTPIVNHPSPTESTKSQRQEPARDVPTKTQPDHIEPVTSAPGIISTPPSQPSKLPGLLRHNSREKVAGPEPPRPNPRRSSATSWISSLSSKLGTSSNPASPGQPGPSVVQSNNHQASVSTVNPFNSASQPRELAEETRPYVPQQPKGGSSFLSNALRRLSSNSQVARGGAAAYNGGVTPRRILNVDQNRPRCMLPELETKKLRRVAFCVDVEIAGAPKYSDDKDGKEAKKEKSSMKAKDKEEGAAMKRPTVVLAEKDSVLATTTSADSNDSTQMESGDADNQADAKDLKKKKKRSDDEKRERKEQKRRKAEESGSIPMQITISNSVESTAEKNPSSNPTATPRPLDRPTTDPLRVYRRCCQLRETPILKRITDQLAAPTACPLNTPGVVTCLDLTGSRLQLTDMVTLSDWLAIVPVRKLSLDDADVNDEGLRVILSGLLAAVTPDFSRKPKNMREVYEERSGVVEKLTLKNNPKITKEGWKHISLFIYMCKSLKAIDVSMNAFPPSPTNLSQADPSDSCRDIVEVFAKSISERLGGSHLEELIMGECSLTTHHIRKIADAVSMSGITRLGLAGNSIDAEGLGYVINYIRSGVCQGLDLGGNDLRGHLDVLAEAFDSTTPIWALSLADCNLCTTSLKPLFPSLLNLTHLKFLDLSHNPELFALKTSALGMLTKYLPMLSELRRLHLNHVDMAPWQAISLADTFGECPLLAHVAILGNSQIAALASARGEEEQEEACALYASLMAAARVSHSIISIEVEVPSGDSSEIVRALAKQVVAYCLRNMESFYPAVSLDAPSTGSSSTNPIPNAFPKEVEIPDVLLHLVGNNAHGEESHNEGDDPTPAPDMDYIVGGTGVVKALNYCLEDMRNGVASQPQSGTASPRSQLTQRETGVKAKNVSRNLLESARRIRERLQPALLRESRGQDDWAFRRLLFLDNTLQGIIERFEAEFPETRVPGSGSQPDNVNKISPVGLPLGNFSTSTLPDASASQTLASANGKDSDSDDDEESYSGRLLRRSSRQPSDVSLAAKALGKEEGVVHKLGQQVKRKILGHEQINLEDGHGTSETSTPGSPGEVDEGLMLATGSDSSIAKRIEDEHIRVLKEKLVMLNGSSSPNLQGEKPANDGHD